MDSEDEMQAALDGISNEPKPAGKSLTYHTYEMIRVLLNRLETSGENLLAYADDTGVTELGGESHTLKYDSDQAQWVITPGRSEE